MADVKGKVASVMEDLLFVARTMKSRGIKRYGRALGICGFALIASYKMVFLAGGAELARIQKALAAAKATAQYADSYHDLEAALNATTGRLAPPDHAEGWFLDTVRDSMKAEGLVALSLSPVSSGDVQNYKVLSLSVTIQAKFKEVAAWVARLEGSRHLVSVSNPTIGKIADKLGQNNISITVSSVAPSGGAR